MESLRGYDDWRTTAPAPVRRCTCGHDYDDHFQQPIYNGETDELENGIPNPDTCTFTDSCGCTGFQPMSKWGWDERY